MTLMAQEAAQTFRCWKCGRRLNVDGLRGSVTVYCIKCKSPNRLEVPASFRQRVISK